MLSVASSARVARYLHLRTMGPLALATLSIPLSIWGLWKASPWPVVSGDDKPIPLSSYLLFAALALLALQLNLSLINRHRFNRRAHALGCGDVPAYPHKDPILGLDAFFDSLRALSSHSLLDLYAQRFASCGSTYSMTALGSSVLVTNEVENIKTILGTNMVDWPIDGPRLYCTLPVLGPNSIFSSNGESWHKARAMLKPSFVRNQISDLKCFDRHIRNMLATIPADGVTFDLQSLLFDMTMDSSTDFMLGHSTGLLTQASPAAQQFVRDFEYASRESAKQARLGPVLHKLPHPKLKKAVRDLREYVRFYVHKAADEKKNGTKSKDRDYVFLDELLLQNPPEEYTIDQVLSVLVAGRDTTATAMASVFYFLARSPAAVARLREEIKTIDNEYPTWEQLRHLKYLNNVIKEGKPSCLFTPP